MALTLADLKMSGVYVRTGPAKSRESEFCCTEGLPKAFLHSLRTLFDILDDSGRGYVHISEIESRWQGADTQDLPAGVLRCLRRVAPPHGCLSFERFVSGLRCSMLNPEYRAHHVKVQATVRPQPQHKAEGKVRPLGMSNLVNTQTRTQTRTGETCGPPPRYGAEKRPGRSVERAPEPNGDCGGGYRVDQNHVPRGGAAQPGGVRSIEGLDLESPRLLRPTGGVGKSGLPRSQSESATGLTGTRRHGRSRDAQRRHTISNGVDYGMLKQMKELEQEKDSLLSGLEVVEQARDWYQTQIHHVNERQRQIGQNHQGPASPDFRSEATQSRMNVLIPKLREVNRCLSELITCTGMPTSPGGSPASSVSSSSQPPPADPPAAPPQAIQRLKDQNRLLTQEVSEKSERITQLEQEKSALIKQLFEARARTSQDTSALDSTFI